MDVCMALSGADVRTNYPDLAKSLAKQHFGCTVVEEGTTEEEGMGEEATEVCEI